MILKKGIQISILLLAMTMSLQAQKISGIYKADDLFNRISSTDTTYILNFWSTWCKPCMQELQAIDSVGTAFKNTTTKLIFVNLDAKGKKNQVNSVLKNKGIQSTCVLLDEANGNVYIDKVSPEWSGSIPTTLLKKGTVQVLLEKKLSTEQLRSELKKFEAAR